MVDTYYGMFTLRKIATYQREVALGLSALTLLLLVMSFTGNWTLMKIIRNLRESTQNHLSSSALDIAHVLERARSYTDFTDRAFAATEKTDFRLRLLSEGFSVQAMSAGNTAVYSDTAEFNALLARLEKEPAALSDYRYVRSSGSEWGFYHCPVYFDGQWYLLVISQRTPLLARAEGATDLLIILGLFVVALVAVGVVSLFRALTRPYGQISEAVSSINTKASDPEGAVSEIVEKYRETIKELRVKELKLVELNERLSYRVSDVERLNAFLLSSLSTGIVILSGDGNLVGMNLSAADYLNLPPQIVEAEGADGEIQKHDYVSLFSETPALKTWVERLLLSGAGEDLDIEIETAANEPRALRLSAIPVCDKHLPEQDNMREVALFISDQTELVKSQRRLEDSRRLATLGEMSAGLAHQLRNSILACLGFGSLARRKASDPTELDALESLLKELNDQSALVDRFLTFAKPLELSPVRIDLAELLDEILDSHLSASVRESRVALTITADGPIEVDTLLLKQAVVNLVDNALEATAGTESVIRITARVDESSLIISVSDDGPGVPAEMLDKIFTPFCSGSAEGAGLGLSLARKMIELHGGSLELDTTTHSGARFVIRTPRYQDGAVLMDGQKESGAPRK